MRKIWKSVYGAIIFSLIMLVICGLIYPLALTGVAQLVFPVQANGSIIEVNGEPVASSIIGQDFNDPRLFHGRSSSINYNTYTSEEKADGTYGGVASGSNNYANTNPDLEKRMEEDIQEFLKNNPTIKRGDIPADLITQSGSGLDPDISVEAAKVQIPAIAKASGLSESRLTEIVHENTATPILGVLGETRVNVVKCNIEIAQEIGMI